MLAPLPAATDYQRAGYEILSGVLDESALAAVQAEAVAVAGGERGAIAGVTPHAGNVLCVHFPHKLSPLLLDIARLDPVVDALTEAIGPNVKLMQSMLFIKPGGKPGQAWHQDEAHIPTRDRSLTGVWLALDDATVDNGCLWVLPGSHRSGVLHPVRPHADPRFDPTPEAYGFDSTGAVPVEVPAGSAVVFDGYLLHRSFPNRTTGPRRALVNHYMSAESLLPWFPPQRGEPMGLVDHRDVVLVAGTDPHAAAGTVDVVRPRLRTERHPSQAFQSPAPAERAVATAAPMRSS